MRLDKIYYVKSEINTFIYSHDITHMTYKIKVINVRPYQGLYQCSISLCVSTNEVHMLEVTLTSTTKIGVSLISLCA